ncbi:MAG: alpha/beta hydrolase [Pseudomonadota bacterium]
MLKISLTFFALLPLWLSPALAERTEINGVELDYEVHGDGPPLYLLHGGMESRDAFALQIPMLAEHFTVVALDSREQGRSGPSADQISYELMSSDLIALAQHLGHTDISVVGLSDGGITALTTAISQPALIDRLVLLGATFHYNSYPEGMREHIANYRWDGNTDPAQYPGNFIEHYMTGHDDLSGFGDLLAEMALMWTTSPTFEPPDLGGVACETLVINGDHNDTALEHALDLYEGLPNAQFFVVPGATHYALLERPDLVGSVILAFLLDEE